MPVTSRFVVSDIETQAAYTDHIADWDMVSILPYFENLVSGWTVGSSVTINSTEVAKLDNTFKFIGNNNQCVLIRPGIGRAARVSSPGTYQTFYNLTTSQGVDWIIGHLDSTGNATDFPHPLDIAMQDLVDRVYAWMAGYLSSLNCPCTTGSFGLTPHARKEHVMAVVISKPNDTGTEMSIGFGYGGAGSSTAQANMAIWNAIDGLGTGYTTNDAGVRLRAQKILDEWAWATNRVYAHLGQICRASLAPGAVFSSWAEVDPMIIKACQDYPDGWLINICTNLEHEYLTGGNGPQRNILALTKTNGQLVGIQTAGASRQPWVAGVTSDETNALFYAAKGYVRSWEHMLSGITCTINANGAGYADDTVASTSTPASSPYGPIQFIESVPNAITSFTAQNIDAFGGWPNTGSFTWKQYALTNASSANSRTATFTTWAPTPVDSGGSVVLGAFAS